MQKCKTVLFAMSLGLAFQLNSMYNEDQFHSHYLTHTKQNITHLQTRPSWKRIPGHKFHILRVS